MNLVHVFKIINTTEYLQSKIVYDCYNDDNIYWLWGYMMISFEWMNEFYE